MKTRTSARRRGTTPGVGTTKFLPMSTPTFQAIKKGNTIYHKGCGGQVMVGGMVHALVDLGFGFRGGKFVVDRKYSKRVSGYTGACLKCRKEGLFQLPAPKPKARAKKG